MKQNDKSAIFDLVIVLAIAFLLPIVHSVYLLFHGETGNEGASQNLSYFLLIIEEALAILLLCYVLFNRGKSLWDLGITLHPKEILFGIGLYFLSYIFDLLACNMLYYAMPEDYLEALTPKNIGLSANQQ